MNRQTLQKACEQAGMTLDRKGEIYVADGFSPIPHVTYQKFGVEKQDFPNGAYCTIWAWIHGDRVKIAQPLLFDYTHDMTIALPDRRRARLNAAYAEARKTIGMIDGTALR